MLTEPSIALIAPQQEKLIKFIGATHPLSTEVTTAFMPEGMTLTEMLRVAQPDPALLLDAVVFIDDFEIPRDNWHVVRPNAGHTVTARVVPYLRGGGGGGKNPFRIILTIAVIAASFFLGPALGANLLGINLATASASGIGLARLVGGAIISIAGNLLINTIAPIKPPQLGQLSGSGARDARESPSLFLDGSRNAPRQFETVPQVLGFFRFRPPLGANTFTEVLGDHNFLRMLVVPGYGELELSNWEIDETPIANFQDFELEVKNGLASDTNLTLYGDQVNQQEFAIKLLQADGFTLRTSDIDTDELSVDVVFPQGLVTFSTTTGNRTQRTVAIQIQFRKIGTTPWINLPADTISTAGIISGADITFSAARSVALRHGFRWKTGERAQWEVQIQRTTLDNTSTQTFDDVFWTTLRSFTLDDPINFRVPLAKAALSIRATEQLSGVVGSLSVLAKSVVEDYDGTPGSTVLRASNNPAALFRHVLQGSAKAIPVPDAEIDITKLEEWHDFCAAKGFTFNMVRDFTSSVQATLEDIAAAGRAGLTMTDGKWSVVIDDVVPVTVTHITPRNSIAFELEKSFEDLPHAWRVRFPNEDKRYKQDEQLVFFDGFSIDGSVPLTVTATNYADLEIPGVTNPDHAFKLGRYFAAVIVNRPERWTVQQDFESIVAKRGSRVKLTHDVLIVGLSSGRISAVGLDGNGDVNTLTLDEPVTMEVGKLYGVTIRRAIAGDTALIAQVVVNAGEQTQLTISPVIPAANAPAVGDIFGFGIRGSETEDALVLANLPESDLTGKLILVPYRPEIFDADSGIIPPFVSNVSDDVFLPAPIVQKVISDESVLGIGAADTTMVQVEIRVQPINEATAVLEVQQRLTGLGEAYYNSAVSQRGPAIVRVGDVATSETWDFRVRWTSPERLVPSPYTPISPHTIVGLSTPPAPLSGLTISVFGGQALLRWDEPPTLDVRFGGTVKFRHTQTLVSPAWSQSVSIGQSAKARSLFATLPLKTGSYMARVFDSIGLPSTIVSVSTKQASVMTFANVSTLDEAPTFSGVHNNTIVAGGGLKLAGTALIDSFADWDAISDFDSTGGISATGTYDFASGFDLVTVKRVRLSTRVTALSDNILDQIDDKTDFIDTWEDFDGSVQAEGDLLIQVRTTDDDPAGSPTWSAWERLDSAEFEARGFEFRAILFSNDPTFNIVITELGVDAEEIV